MLEEVEELKDKKMDKKKEKYFIIPELVAMLLAMGRDSFARTRVERGFTHTNELTTQ